MLCLEREHLTFSGSLGQTSRLGMVPVPKPGHGWKGACPRTGSPASSASIGSSGGHVFWLHQQSSYPFRRNWMASCMSSPFVWSADLDIFPLCFSLQNFAIIIVIIVIVLFIALLPRKQAQCREQHLKSTIMNKSYTQSKNTKLKNGEQNTSCSGA